MGRVAVMLRHRRRHHRGTSATRVRHEVDDESGTVDGLDCDGVFVVDFLGDFDEHVAGGCGPLKDSGAAQNGGSGA